MAWCCQAPSHYLNQYWLIVNKTLQNTLQCIYTGNVLKTNKKMYLEQSILNEMQLIFLVANELQKPLG